MMTALGNWQTETPICWLRSERICEAEYFSALRTVAMYGCLRRRLRLHFGLGSATRADSITVRWPSGEKRSCGMWRRTVW